ncbi:MAG: TonB-dependent receptor [Mucilaginibacter sp.]|uniref:TonB-dependent receptor n=1 Tax=Mucilaginibacter sp. TaxID=1882438 RepID=UPI0031AC27EE
MKFLLVRPIMRSGRKAFREIGNLISGIDPALKRKIVMRINLVIILITSAFLHVSASSYAQKITLSKNNARLVSIIKDIQAQSEYDFVYSSRLIKNAHNVNVTVNNASLKDVLDLCFKDQPFTYVIENKTIIIKAIELAQPDVNKAIADITGKVTDDNGKPLPGATVKIKGSTNVVACDLNGNFLIKGVSSSDVLLVSFTGYVTQEIALGKTNSLLVIALKEEQKALSEVVVVGYGSVQKKDLTGAVSTVLAKDLDNMPVTRVDQMLQGRAAGVDVKSSNGAPGSGTSIRIRGSRSISASNEPLYVIDGLIGVADLNTINPSDIESIDILKDASATAIYGSRAANGVILVTTKKGQANKDATNFNVIYGVQQLPHTLDLMNARQFAEFINESRIDENRAPVYPDVNAAVAKVGEAGTNWTDATTRPAGYQSYNLSTSGGTKGLTYFISGNVIDQDGIINATGYKRYQGRVNLNKTFNDKLNMGLTLNASHYVVTTGNVNYGANSGWVGSMITLPPTMPLRKADGSYESYNPIWYSGGDIDTPPVVAEKTENYNTVNNLQSNLFLEYQVIKGLKVRSSFGTSISSNRSNYFQPSDMPSKIATKTETANASSSTGTSVYVLNENTVTYDRSFGDHHLNALAGFTYENTTSNSMSISATGLTDDILKYNYFDATPQANRVTRSGSDANTRLSYLGRINYDYKSRYYLTLTGRSDGASNFAADHKWGFFPSFGTKWRVSEEPFFKSIKADNLINNMAFRFSYGLSGNQGIKNYQSLAALSTVTTVPANGLNVGTGYIFGGTPVLGYTQSLLANPDLTWETSSQMDVGTDLELFNGRLSVDANYYKTKTKNLLLNVQIPTQTGFGSRLINLGKTESQGFEFLVSGDVIRSRNFKWTSTLTVSTNQQKILDIGPLVKVSLDNNGYGANTNYLEVGVPIGANYGVDYKGVWHNQAEIDAELAKPAGQRTLVSASGFYKPGKPRYGDVNHDGVLNVDDYHYLGTPNPKLFGGFGNTLAYKNLSLDFFFEYASGSTMYNDIEFFMGSGAEYTNQFAYMTNRWTPTNTSSDIPGVNSRDNVPNSRFLHDASFIRLKSLQLSYNLAKFMPKTFKKFEVFFSGTNLLLFTKYNGFDPEVNKGAETRGDESDGGTSSTIRAKDDGVYPNARTYALGINVSF